MVKFEVSGDIISIDVLPKKANIRDEFLSNTLESRPLYEDATLKYKDPEEIKLYIRDLFRKRNFTILHGEVDHWSINFGKGPMFRQVETKVFLITFKGIRREALSSIIGLTLVILSLVGIFYGMLIFAISPLFFVSLILSAIFGVVGYYIYYPATIWIKASGAAFRVKGKEILSDIYFQFSGAYGIDLFGTKLNNLRKDFDEIFDSIVKHLGKVGEE